MSHLLMKSLMGNFIIFVQCSISRFCIDFFLRCVYPINLFNLFKLRIILCIPLFFELVNAPNTKLFLSLIFTLDKTFLSLSLATSLFTITFSSADKGNEKFQFAFGVFIKSNFRPFSMVSRINLLLVIFFYCTKLCFRFPSLKL